MKFLIFSFFLSLSLCADMVMFNDGRIQKGQLSWKSAGLQFNNKSLKLSDVLKLRFDRPLIANEGEYIIFKDGSLLKAQSTKLINDEKVLLVDYRGEERKLKLEFISAISFQGAHYPQKTKPGFYTLNDFHYPGEASYFTKSSIGQSTPLKKRHKKPLLKTFVFQAGEDTSSEYVFQTTSREIIHGKILKQNSDSLVIETLMGAVTYPFVEICVIENRKERREVKSSELQNIRYTPFIDQCRELRFKRSYTNSSIVNQGFSTVNFIALHSRTEFSLMAKQGVRALSFSMAMDPQSYNGHLVLSMSQDGKELFKKELRSGESHSDLFVPLSQGEIKVLLDYGQGGSAGDYLILLNPQFIGGK
jgi:hypothetical protein